MVPSAMARATSCYVRSATAYGLSSFWRTSKSRLQVWGPLQVPPSQPVQPLKSKATSTKECPPSNVPVVVNELLTYVNVYRDRASAENLRKILSGFYTASEINTAKKLMVCTFAADLAECPLKAERRKSMTRGVNEVEVDDIVGIFDYLDQRSNLSKATFAVANLERVGYLNMDLRKLTSVLLLTNSRSLV